MADPNLGDSSGAPAARCPWCSGALSDPDAKTCPTCGANLANEADAQLPGLTAIDLEKLAFRRTVAPRRNRLMSWISGDLDYENAADPVAPPGSLEPPPFEVRREMLRLEMAAMIADLTAEAGALAADEAVAQGTDPAAAAAAIQAEVDAAARAEALNADGASPAEAPLPGAADAPVASIAEAVAPEPAAPEASPVAPAPAEAAPGTGSTTTARRRSTRSR